MRPIEVVIPARTSFDPLAPAAKRRPSRVGTRSRLVRTGMTGTPTLPHHVPRSVQTSRRCWVARNAHHPVNLLPIQRIRFGPGRVVLAPPCGVFQAAEFNLFMLATNFVAASVVREGCIGFESGEVETELMLEGPLRRRGRHGPKLHQNEVASRRADNRPVSTAWLSPAAAADHVSLPLSMDATSGLPAQAQPLFPPWLHHGYDLRTPLEHRNQRPHALYRVSDPLPF